MTKMTKTQLVDENIRLRAECARLEQVCLHWQDTAAREQQAAGEYLMRAERAEEQIADLVPTPVAPKPQFVRAARQLPAHFAAAREAAMRMGRSVKVSAS